MCHHTRCGHVALLGVLWQSLLTEELGFHVQDLPFLTKLVCVLDDATIVAQQITCGKVTSQADTVMEGMIITMANGY